MMLLSFLFCCTSALASTDQIVLAPGRFADVPAPGGLPVTVANGGVIRVADRGKVVRVTAKKNGTSEIRIGARIVRVTVVNDETARLYSRLQTMTAASRGLRISVENSVIWLRGRLLRWDDWLAVSEVAQDSPVHFRFGAEIEEELRTKVLRELRKRIRDAALPETSIEVKPVARVSVPSNPQELSKRIREVLGPFGFDVQTSSTALSLEPLVRVRIVVAELIKTKTLQYGITWPATLRAQLLPTFGLAPDGFGLDLSALEEKGLGRVLASPTLLCRSGKEASFVAGGELPVKIMNQRRTEVVWKQYGVILRIKPLADYSGKMSIALETEVSALDRVGAVDGVPSVHTNRIESHFDLTSSRTIALSGLIKSDQAESSGGLPGLSSLPVLGSLFSSKSFIDKKTELVVFVTPDIAKDDE